MRYKEFTFKNFKGIEEMTITLTEGVTTLIGLNESGKTTILEAIFCFSYGAEDLDAINSGMASLRNPEQWIPISRRANFNDAIEIGAVVILDNNDKMRLQKHMLEQHGLTLTNIPGELKITEQYLFENSRYSTTKRSWSPRIEGLKSQQKRPRPYGVASAEWQTYLKYVKENLPRIWYFPNFLFELPERFDLRDPAGLDDEGLDKSRFYKSTFENILGQLGYGATLEDHLIQRLQSTDRADRRSLDSLLLDMSRSITKTILDGWNRIFGRDPGAQEVQLAADSDSDSAAFLELRIKGEDGYYDLSERSLGFRWFFMFLLMTSFQGDSAIGSKPLFLLDEPASNLHSSAQAELLKSFENLLGRCTLAYTTHSHHLINIRWLDGAYVVKNAGLGSLDLTNYLTTRMGARTSVSATKYRQFVAENPDQTSYFQPVLDVLDYQPSALEPVPNVVLVEGKSDYFVIRYMVEIIGIKCDLRMVPGGGAGALDTVIRLHIGWGKSFLILLDGDAEGIKQRDRYVAEFGPLVKDRCVILPDMCQDPNIKEAEDLLSPADKAAIFSKISGAGAPARITKKALQRAIMELYARKESISVDQATVDLFERLVAQLAERLA